MLWFLQYSLGIEIITVNMDNSQWFTSILNFSPDTSFNGNFDIFLVSYYAEKKLFEMKSE